MTPGRVAPGRAHPHARALVQVTVNGHGVALPGSGLAGVEIKHEAVAQGAVLELGFDLWVGRGGRWARVYDEDVIAIRAGQEFLVITSDDHGMRDLATGGDHVVAGVASPPADGWSLVVAPRLWTRLSRHLLADGGDHAAVLLADRAAGPRGPRLLARELIPADDADYCEGSAGYWSLSSAFIRDAVVRARDEQLAYLAIHTHRGTTTVGFSRIDLASHDRGYPALRQVTGQLVGALVLTPMAAAGELWLPEGTRAPLAEVVVPGPTVRRLHPRPRPVAARSLCGLVSAKNGNVGLPPALGEETAEQMGVMLVMIDLPPTVRLLTCVVAVGGLPTWLLLGWLAHQVTRSYSAARVRGWWGC